MIQDWVPFFQPISRSTVAVRMGTDVPGMLRFQDGNERKINLRVCYKVPSNIDFISATERSLPVPPEPSLLVVLDLSFPVSPGLYQNRFLVVSDQWFLFVPAQAVWIAQSRVVCSLLSRVLVAPDQGFQVGPERSFLVAPDRGFLFGTETSFLAFPVQSFLGFPE